MRQHRELFESVRRFTDMWIAGRNYDSVAAFVLGYDAACEGGVLVGFREWLLLRKCVGAARNLAWDALVLNCAFPAESTPRTALTSFEAERHAIEVLFTLLTEFDTEVRERHDGLATVFAEYVRSET